MHGLAEHAGSKHLSTLPGWRDRFVGFRVGSLVLLDLKVHESLFVPRQVLAPLCLKVHLEICWPWFLLPI